jgi:eukaryotic-like serine/threonine-protein kinase
MVLFSGTELETGQRIGDYQIVRKLGSGGLGAVYEVQHVASRRSEAMKIRLPLQGAAADSPERFVREIQLLAALDHPNIARLHNAFYHQDQLVMVMELVSGDTLRKIASTRAIPLPKVIEYAEQVLSALEYAHARGVIHRDIKPTNIMVGRDGRLKLLDFGIATSSQAADLTQSGMIVGTLNYLSPEQIQGHKATTRSDIYSAGVMFYELLTGRLPFTGATYYEVLTAHVNQEPVFPVVLNPGVPESLARAVMRALTKHPAERFPTAQAFLTAMTASSAAELRDVQSIPTRSIEVPSKSGAGSSASQPRPAPNPNLPVEEVTKRLATYLGPIAKIIVPRLASKSRDTDDLYARAAEQIPMEADRRKFLLSRHK